MGLEKWDAHVHILPGGRNVYRPDPSARAPLKMRYGMDILGQRLLIVWGIGLQCYLGVIMCCLGLSLSARHVLGGAPGR